MRVGREESLARTPAPVVADRMGTGEESPACAAWAATTANLDAGLPSIATGVAD
ncbi:MAG: hypothetical protein P4L26_09220 [Terracidiphilus sp.]|nr:hypothetical protein [Terracidiphilus sp.]